MNSSQIEVLFSPAEFSALRTRDLRRTVCVVLDILRATTSIITALENGAQEVVPVETIEEAVALKRADSSLLLAGERHGLRITAAISGAMDFDFGNSPREFTQERVGGRRLAMTTTNGTRALKACTGAQEVLAAGFLNLEAVKARLSTVDFSQLVIVCSGTYEEASYEDTLAAGALVDLLDPGADDLADSAQIARNVYRAAEGDLLAAIGFARNGRRLLGMPALAADVPFCLRRNTTTTVAALVKGLVIKIAPAYDAA